MKIIATLTPEDVKPSLFQVRCLQEGCWLEATAGACAGLGEAQAFAESHVRNSRHPVVIEMNEEV